MRSPLVAGLKKLDKAHQAYKPTILIASLIDEDQPTPFISEVHILVLNCKDN